MNYKGKRRTFKETHDPEFLSDKQNLNKLPVN